MYLNFGQITTLLFFIFSNASSGILNWPSIWNTPPAFSAELASLNTENQINRAPIILGQGEQRLLRVHDVLKFSLGSPIARVLPYPHPLKLAAGSPNGLLLKGISIGTGDLWIWKKDGTTEVRTVRVEKTNSEVTNTLLEKALSKLEETEIIFTGNGAVLRGNVLSLSESAKISALLRAFPSELHDETEISAQLLDQGQLNLDQWLRGSRYGNVLRIERINQNLWVRGSLERNSEKLQAEKRIKAIFPLALTEIDTLPDHSPTVYFKVFLLELRKSQFHAIGLSWPSSIAPAFQVTTGGIQDLIKMDLTLQQLEGKGEAKILSNPELVVRAPGEAELFAGGEIPIRSLSRFTSSVSWKNYGLTLKLKVAQATGDRVRLDIFTEVSHLDQRNSDDNIPGIQSNRMKTQVDALFGTPLLLSGLLQEGIRTEAKGLPFLRKIPVLGYLFGSEDYLNERSELVAILYPHAAPPRAPIERFSQANPRILPKGPVPIPRDWISPSEEQNIRKSENYPWNILD